MNKNTWSLALVITLLVLVGGYLLMKGKTISKTPIPKVVKVTLSAESKSGESGEATLTQADGKVVVSISLTGAPKGVAQPAHIHSGVCPGVGPIVYPLTSVRDGKSETTINASLDQILAQGPLALNVHKSVSESKVYISCGTISK